MSEKASTDEGPFVAVTRAPAATRCTAEGRYGQCVYDAPWHVVAYDEDRYETETAAACSRHLSGFVDEALAEATP